MPNEVNHIEYVVALDFISQTKFNTDYLMIDDDDDSKKSPSTVKNDQHFYLLLTN